MFYIMLHYCKLYLLLAGAYVRSRLQYRLSFSLMCVAIIIGEACMLGLLGALFTKFRTVNGWTLTEVAFLYSLGNLAYSLMRILGSQLDDFDRYIVRGDLDIVLVRPLPPLFYILASRVELIHVSRLFTSIVIFVVVFHLMHIHLNLCVAVFVIITIFSGAVIMFTFVLISATVALWTTKSGKLTDILTGASKEAVTFPISIYPLAVRILLTFILPVAFVTYYPAQHILHKNEFLGMPEYFQFGAPFVAVALLLFSYIFWRLGLRRYHSTGS
jgi:ABC-2 type transport system permease protein